MVDGAPAKGCSADCATTDYCLAGTKWGLDAAMQNTDLLFGWLINTLADPLSDTE